MLSPIDKLTITVTKTADGRYDYVQIMSGDQFSLNIVLIVRQIVVRELRAAEKENERER